jgi:hypothetical protein
MRFQRGNFGGRPVRLQSEVRLAIRSGGGIRRLTASPAHWYNLRLDDEHFLCSANQHPFLTVKGAQPIKSGVPGSQIAFMENTYLYQGRHEKCQEYQFGRFL